MTLRTGSNSGVSLIEVMMAVVLLAVASVFVLQSLAAIARAQAVSEGRFIAYDFAAGKLEDLRREAAETFPREPGGGSFRAGRRLFQWEVSYAPVSWTDRLETAELSVRWQQGGDTYSARFATTLPVPEEQQG